MPWFDSRTSSEMIGAFALSTRITWSPPSWSSAKNGVASTTQRPGRAYAVMKRPISVQVSDSSTSVVAGSSLSQR